MYYTKDGIPTLYPQTEEDRFAMWVTKLSDPRTGIPLPTSKELKSAYEAPCRYRRAARASRA
jgi:hypothetical protein